jgi:alginate O-acetyltransferase complex protein AlgJ
MATEPLPEQSTREAEALAEMARTAVSPAVARLLGAVFIAMMAGVPLGEWAGSIERASNGTESAWSNLANVSSEIEAGAKGDDIPIPLARFELWSRVVSSNRIALAALNRFERALADQSLFAQWFRPVAQVLMTGVLGVGAEDAYVGEDGWLFFRRDVEYVTGPGFLDSSQQARRIAAAEEWTNPPQPDPREAIVRFSSDLAARGIALIVLPTPVKPSIHPEKLAERYTGYGAALQNPSFDAFTSDLRRAGIVVFDPSEALVRQRRAGPQYLATDSHWRPESMEAVAELLGGFVEAQVGLPRAAHPGFRVERVQLRNTGDIARMLDLPPEQTLLPEEPVHLRRILQSDGSPWRPSRSADVLVLGDSFTNIYSLDSMRWGTSAGFAEQLSYALRRPVDRIVQNDEGAFATRAMLAADAGRLAGKRVVIYQFAARELAFGDWRIIRM